ncbi:MAG: hypothetical protein ACLT1C_06165 [Weissella confusa]
MNSGSYPGKNFVMFRRTDGKGQLDNIRNLTPDAHPEILYPVQLNKHGSNEVTLTWTPDKADENKESGPIQVR